MIRLQINSASSTTEFSIESDGEWQIGRHPDSDIPINDPMASRRHGKLSMQDGVICYTDLRTGNGTNISGVAIEPDTPIELQLDDVIEIGDYQITIQEADDNPAPLPVGAEDLTGVLTSRHDQAMIDLGREPVLMGRMPLCQVQIDDPGSSRINTEIVHENGRYIIRDLGSSNGTFVNDQRIQKQALNPEDTIKIGDKEWRFSYAKAEEVKAAETHEKPPLPTGCNLISIGLISAIISGLGVYLYMSNRQQSAGEPQSMGNPGAVVNKSAPVVIGRPIVADIPVTLTKTGNVHLARQDVIPFPLGQKVTKVHVQNGQRVKKDQPLVTFELSDELRSNRKQANAALNQAREDVAKTQTEIAKADAVLENARTNLTIIQNTHDRSLPVYQNGNLLQKEWDQVLVKLAEAKAAVKLREAEKEQAKRTVSQSNQRVVQVQTDVEDVERLIGDLSVTANSPGIVNRLDLKDGYTVTPANNSMEIIEYDKEVKVIVSVSEDEITFVKNGMQADVYLPRAVDRVYRGEVSFIPPTAINRNYNVELQVPNQNYHFRPGQQVTARFTTETRSGALLVPLSAVNTDSRNGYYLFVVEPTSRLAQLVKVKRGQEIKRDGNNYIEVIPVAGNRGLSPNDLIIFQGNRAVKDGMAVTIQNESLLE